MAVGDLAQNIQEISRLNPYAPEGSPQDYTGASKGAKSREAAPVEYAKHENTVFAGNLRKTDDVPTQHDTFVHPVIVDRSKGILYEGLGKAAADGITVGDQLYKSYIRSEVQGQIDSVRDEFGVAAADAVYGQGNGPVPAELEKQASYLSDLTEAYQTGVLKESHYWAKMDVLARGMRSRFPLYSEYVDKVVASATGNVPANALRRALAYEAQDAAENSPEKKLQALEDWATKNGRLPEDYFTRRNHGAPYALPELQEKIAKETAFDETVSRRKARMELDSSTDKVNQDFVKNTARMELWNRFEKTMAGVNGSFAKDYKGLMELANGAYKDKNVTPDEAAAIRQAWMPLRQMMMDNFRQTMMQETTPGSGISYMGVLDKPSVDDIQGSVTLFLDSMEDALVNQRFGILGSNQAFLEAIKSSDQLTILGQAPFLRKQQALKETVGPEMANTILSHDEAGLSATAKAISDLTTMELHTAPNGSAPLAQEFDKQWENGNKDPKYYRTQLDRVVLGIANPDSPPEARANVANNVFAEDFTYRFSKADQQKYYMQFTSPGFVAQMGKLVDEGQEDAWNSFEEWSLSKANNINRTALHDARAVVTNRPNLRLKINPKTSMLEVDEEVTNAGVSTYGSGLSMAMEKVFLEPAAKTAITEVNTALKGLIAIANEKGEDPNEYIMNFLQLSGIAINKPDMGPKKNAIMNFYDLIGDAFSSHLAAMAAEAEKGMSGKN